MVHLLKNADRQLKEVHEENLALKQEIEQIKDEVTKQLDVWKAKFKIIKKKMRKTRS